MNSTEKGNKNEDKIIRYLKIFSSLFLVFSIGFCTKKVDIYLTSIQGAHTVQNVSLYKEERNIFQGLVLATNTFFIEPLKTGQIDLNQIPDLFTEPAVISNFNSDYDTPPVSQRSNTVRIPIFVYHHIGPNPDTYWEKINNVTTQTFREQMDYLLKKQYKVLSMQEYYDLLEKGVNPVQKSVLLTFDDGYQDFYDNAYPILKEYKYNATIFVPLDKKEISDAQLLEMSNNGIDIESHTLSHASLNRVLSNSILNLEVNDSMQKITNLLNKEPIAFAYPYCVYNQNNLNYVRGTKYKLSFKCGNTKGNSIDNSFANRYEIYRSWAYNNMQNFIDRLSGIEYRPSDIGPSELKNTKLKML